MTQAAPMSPLGGKMRDVAVASDGDVTGILIVADPIPAAQATGDAIHVPVMLHHVDTTTSAVLLDGRVIGFIRLKDGNFLALCGPMLVDAHECGRSAAWERAIGRLYVTDRRRRDAVSAPTGPKALRERRSLRP